MQLLAQSSVPRMSGPSTAFKLPCALWPGALVALRPFPPPRRHIVAGCREERGTASPDTDGVSATHAEPRNETAAAPVLAAATLPSMAPAATTAQQQQPQQPPGFTSRRLAVFSGLVLGYAAYYLTRNSLTYAAPVMVADPALNFTMEHVGILTSIFPVAYGLSKFLSGILGDRYSPSALLFSGLVCTAACNLALGAGSEVAWFAIMWTVNGLAQGLGAPCCARMLTSWFAARERGTYWGLWNVAHNLGGFLSPLVAATAAHAAGWRWGMWAPGLAGMALGLYVLLVCRDTPQDAGFNPVEPAQSPSPSSSRAGSGTSSSSSSSGNGDRSSGGVVASSSAGDGKVLTAAAGGSSSSSNKMGSTARGEQPGGLRAAMDNVLSNPHIWTLALTYFCVYAVRQSMTSWTVFYLINEKGVPDAAQAAMRVSGLELGGLVGGLAAGRLSDLLIRRANGVAGGETGAAEGDGGGDGGGKGATASAAGVVGAGSVGKRVQVVMMYAAALAAALAAFQALPAGAPPALQWLSVAAIGFFIYGPQMLIGLCGAELVHPASVGASQGLLGWVAYLGAANAGAPLSWIITRFGWGAYFTSLIAACVMAMMLLASLMNLPSYAQLQQQQLQQQQQQQMAAGEVGTGMEPKVA